MTRDDFPFSLQPYAMPEGGDATADVEGWSLVLFRAADEAERAWFRDHGFSMKGRVWVREASAVCEPEAAPDDAGEPDPDPDADPAPAPSSPEDPSSGVAA